MMEHWCETEGYAAHPRSNAWAIPWNWAIFCPFETCLLNAQGQTRQHARLLCLLGVKQLCVGVNKMDSDTAGYKEERYNEIKDEMKHMLTKVCVSSQKPGE
jgi:translation elongation factor EF-1alpha